jgi:hypothetical protein
VSAAPARFAAIADIHGNSDALEADEDRAKAAGRMDWARAVATGWLGP